MKHSMAVPRTQPLKLVSPEQMVERMNATFDAIARRAFEIFEGTGGRLGRDLEDWLQAEAQLIHPVHVRSPRPTKRSPSAPKSPASPRRTSRSASSRGF